MKVKPKKKEKEKKRKEKCKTGMNKRSITKKNGQGRRPNGDVRTSERTTVVRERNRNERTNFVFLYVYSAVRTCSATHCTERTVLYSTVL